MLSIFVWICFETLFQNRKIELFLFTWCFNLCTNPYNLEVNGKSEIENQQLDIGSPSVVKQNHHYLEKWIVAIRIISKRLRIRVKWKGTPGNLQQFLGKMCVFLENGNKDFNLYVYSHWVSSRVFKRSFIFFASLRALNLVWLKCLRCSWEFVFVEIVV